MIIVSKSKNAWKKKIENMNENVDPKYLFGSTFTFPLFTHCSSTVHTLFMGLTTTLFRKKYIKNGSYGTIYTFKNYFATVFLVFNFQF